MPDAESLANLDEDLPAVEEFVAANDGDMQADTNVAGLYWMTLRPRVEPAERFVARVAWQAYPDQPPSVLFADGVGGATNVPRAWPVIPGYRAPNDICKPFTAEGFGLHAEWTWSRDGNRFLWVVEVMQQDLDIHYGGRAA